jgi:hypothetical protein
MNTDTSALGPDPYDPAVRRKNVRTLLIVAVLLIGAGFIPATLRRVQQPEERFEVYQEAADAKAVERGLLPRFVPATATEIHTRHNRDTNQRFVRFTYPPAELGAFTTGMRALPQEEVERVMVPTPGWSRWWPITSRTLSGSQGERLRVWEIASGPDRGYLAADPRTNHAFFWSRPARS